MDIKQIYLDICHYMYNVKNKIIYLSAIKVYSIGKYFCNIRLWLKKTTFTAETPKKLLEK